MRKGFTLIELLVVIAIIGILSSVVLASLNTARSKGADAAIKSNLGGIKVQAELVYDDNNGSYVNVCASSSDALNAAKTAAGASNVITVWGTTGGTGLVTCHASSSVWAVESPLKTSGFYCVDSTGISTTSSVFFLGASDGSCK